MELKNNIFLKAMVLLFLIIINNAKAQWTVKTSQQKCFIENKGQFNNKVRKGHVAFGTNNIGYQFYFLKDRFVLRYDEIITKVKKEKKIEKEEDEEVFRTKTKTTLIEYKWINANKDVQIVAEDTLLNVYNYAEKVEGLPVYNCKAYKKLIYKNLYNGVDVEFVFHEKTGIKYSYIIYPGADYRQIKMEYSGNSKPIILEGKLLTDIRIGTIEEQAPITFYQTSNKKINSSFDLKNNMLSYKLNNYDETQTIIIDPWIIPVVLPTNDKAYEIQKDPSGNVYVYGGAGNPFTINKYNSSGTLVWTLSLPSPGSWYGDMLVQNNNFSYASTPPFIYKINNVTGTIIWTSGPTPNAEFFRLIENCDKSKIYACGNNAVVRMSEVNQTTGTTIATIIPAFPPLFNNEIKSICTAPNGNWYALTNANCRLAAISPGLAGLWHIPNGYTFNYWTPLNLPGPTGNGAFNGIACNNKFIFTYDGTRLMKRDICNGALLTSTIVPTSVMEDDWGLLLDSCGYLYVGSQSAVYKYDSNLTLITSSVTPGKVYDISIGINPGEILVCGDGFAQSMNMGFCQPVPFSTICPVLTATISSISPPCNSSCIGSATITPTGTGPFEYLWSPGGFTTQVVSGLCPGTYSVFLTDRYIRMCSPIVFTITSGTVPNRGATVSNSITCANPTAILTGTSSTSGVTYSWSPLGVTSPTVSTAIPGNYTLTVTNPVNGCSSTTVVTVSASTNSLILNTTVTDAYCGSPTGTVIIGITGGAPNYTITEGGVNIASGAVSSYTLTGVSLGSHTFVISSSNSCNQTLIVNILDLCVLPVQLTKFSASCADRKATIKWTTATEINCDSFLLYRRSNQIDFAAPI
ncbi:MAG: hypothetical protein ACK50L_06170, partial [Bacteroidota bacterium]